MDHVPKGLHIGRQKLLPIGRGSPPIYKKLREPMSGIHGVFGSLFNWPSRMMQLHGLHIEVGTVLGLMPEDILGHQALGIEFHTV